MGVAINNNTPSGPPPCPPKRAIKSTAATRMPGIPTSAISLQNRQWKGAAPDQNAYAAETTTLTIAATSKTGLLKECLGLLMIPHQRGQNKPNLRDMSEFG